MIIRVFRGRVKPSMLASLDQVLNDVTAPLVRAQAGLVSYYVGKPTETNPYEFLVLTLWADLEALKKFTGEHWEDAVIPDRMASVLEASFVHHYIDFRKG